MALSPDQLSSTLKHLKRTPAPKAPGLASGGADQIGPINLKEIKLKKTGKRESLIEESVAFSHENENKDELNSLMKKRLAKFEHQEDPHAEGEHGKPRLMPKPKFRKNSERSEENCDTVDHSIESIFETGDVGLNLKNSQMKPLPSLQSIGKIPPPKPTKPLILGTKIQKQYKNHQVIIAPKIQPAAEAVENGQQRGESIGEEIEEDIYDDICSGETESPPEPHRPPPIRPPKVPEPIEDDTYDDVEELAVKVKAELRAEQKSQPDVESLTDDFYDDCNQPLPGITSVTDGVEGEFGEDLYEGVEGISDIEQNGIAKEMDSEVVEQKQTESTPAIQSNKEEDSKKKEKERKEREKKEKELQKKKEKEEQRRRKEEEKQEREKKKKEEEERRRREKFDKELKKVHKLKGNENIITKGAAKEDVSSTGRDIPCAKGTVLEVVLKDNCPSGKWLVRTPQGHLGYILSTLLEIAVEESDEALDEDLYECVDTFKSQDPPSSSNIPVDDQEDVYDDTLMEDEDLYDDIPGA